jgi:D-3-phosphoglycerate dehydrogenase
MRAGHWDKSTHKSVELGGRTIGLVGLVGIGVRFARMVDAMDMRVIGFNTARGGLVDEDALLAALRSGQAAAAGLDSFAVEPLPAEHPFRAEPRIVLSPHIGGVTADAYVAMGVGAAKNVLASLAARAR